MEKFTDTYRWEKSRTADALSTSKEYMYLYKVFFYAVQTSEALIEHMTLEQLIALAAQYGIIIDKEHFVQKWHERFGDSQAFIRATFSAYDNNKDDKLSILELEGIVLHALMTVGKSRNFFCSFSIFTLPKTQLHIAVTWDALIDI